MGKQNCTLGDAMQMWAPAFSTLHSGAKEKQPPKHKMMISFSDRQDLRVDGLQSPIFSVHLLLFQVDNSPARERALCTLQGCKGKNFWADSKCCIDSPCQLRVAGPLGWSIASQRQSQLYHQACLGTVPCHTTEYPFWGISRWQSFTLSLCAYTLSHMVRCNTNSSASVSSNHL